MKHLLVTFLIIISNICQSQERELLYLWPGKVPGEIKEKQKPVIDTTRKDGVLRYTEITNPAIEVWLPDAKVSNGAAVIVCPGGGYVRLAYDKEGTEIAAWLNKQGYAAFVLSYRVPNKRYGAFQDAQRALRIVRSNALKWNLNTDKIGIIGFYHHPSCRFSFPVRLLLNRLHNMCIPRTAYSDNFIFHIHFRYP